MTSPALPGGLANLLRPEAYPHAVTSTELIQTHISYVFLTDTDVYKVKKPLDLGFLDFTTLEARRVACERELALNRRLCAEAYHGVVPLVATPAGLAVGGPGDEARAAEWAVHMRRLPESGFLDHRIRAGDVPPGIMPRLADRLVRFHAEAATSDEIARYGLVDVIAANWQENLDQVRPYIGRTIDQATFDEIAAFVSRVVEEDAGLFAERAAAGRVRDGHGDMRSDSVFLREDGGFCIIDCIEFNDRFRYADVASDLAFLLMDLERLGAPELADELAGRYLARSFDETLPLTLPFYRCYRAFIRGKVRGFELDEPEVPPEQRTKAEATARALFAHSLRFARARRARPIVVTMSGPAGGGKSYAGTALASRIGAALLRSDVIRKELAGLDPATPARGEFDSGLYAPSHSRRTFDELYRRARGHLERGRSVVLDATFGTPRSRADTRRLARKHGAGYALVECTAPLEVLRARLVAREGIPGEPSDATLAVAERLRERYQPPDPERDGPLAQLDTSATLGELMTQLGAELPWLFSPPGVDSRGIV